MASLATPLPAPPGFKIPILLAELFAHLLTLSLGPFSNNSFQHNKTLPASSYLQWVGHAVVLERLAVCGTVDEDKGNRCRHGPHQHGLDHLQARAVDVPGEPRGERQVNRRLDGTGQPPRGQNQRLSPTKVSPDPEHRQPVVQSIERGTKDPPCSRKETEAGQKGTRHGPRCSASRAQSTPAGSGEPGVPPPLLLSSSRLGPHHVCRPQPCRLAREQQGRRGQR